MVYSENLKKGYLMFDKSKREESDKLDKVVDKLMNNLLEYNPEDKEFIDAMNHLDRITQMRAKDRPNRVSRDTMAIVIGNLLGILVIVAYEQKHVMTSKGLGQILKPK